MLCINNPYTNPYFNLAAEEYLFRTFTENIFMIWQNEPSVIVGRHQNVGTEADLDFARKRQIKIARRYTGGGAVYHDLGNVNLTFIQSRIDIDFNQFSSRIISFLATLGVDVRTDERHGLTVNGLKISGSAQSIRKNRMIHHATLLFSSDLNVLTAVLEGPRIAETGKKNERQPVYVKSVKSPVTNISGHLTHPIDNIEDFKTHILDYFLQSDIANQLYTFSQSDIESIEVLNYNKYATEKWIFGK